MFNEKEKMLEKVNKDLLTEILQEGEQLDDKEINIKSLLNQWSSNKCKIYQLFDNNLKLEKEFESVISYSEFEKLHTDLIRDVRRKINDNLNIDIEKEWKIADILISISKNEFAENKKEDMKISKYLKKQFKENNLEFNNFIVLNDKNWSLLDYINLQISKLIPKMIVKDSIIISIDPVDFLTMSSGNSWQSCHRIRGENASGTLAYMADQSTVICYTRSSTQKARVDGKEGIQINYPAKKWRQVAYLNIEQGSAIFSRHYPDIREQYSKQARILLNRQIAKYHNIESNYTIKRNITDTNYSLIDIIETGNLQYPDYKHSKFDVTIQKNINVNYPIKFFIGEFPFCIHCKCEIIDNNEILLCDDCLNLNRFTCYRCGDSVDEEDVFVNRYGDPHCERCYRELYNYCEKCNKEIFKGDTFMSEHNDIMCESCFIELHAHCEDCDELFHVNDLDEYEAYQLLCNDCIETREEEEQEESA